jgi:hypothetical protein
VVAIKSSVRGWIELWIWAVVNVLNVLGNQGGGINSLLRAADRYAYTGCGSTAYCYLFYLRDEQILIDIRKSCRSSACLVRIAGPCPAEPVQLVPAQLGLSPAGPYQLWCTSLRITTDTRPVRNTLCTQQMCFVSSAKPAIDILHCPASIARGYEAC